MVNSSQHKLAQWLCKLIGPIRDWLSRFTVEDSFQLKTDLPDIGYRNCFLALHDVTSLFTNISVEEAVGQVCKHAHDVGFPMDELKTLLNKCVRDVQSSFNGKLYNGEPAWTDTCRCFHVNTRE
ncbi:hypothetical protein FGIG_01054 [Fasciola gigantica]|uniref:Reverse transcriptase domain-containing protein n=1 Tax=Fasciola gigantica TaxID=46835 RepID=A0A504ZA23_FASGI|nr:hypothetical protein FGIG_01054 [Fasciola gigantica]